MTELFDIAVSQHPIAVLLYSRWFIEREFDRNQPLKGRSTSTVLLELTEKRRNCQNVQLSSDWIRLDWD